MTALYLLDTAVLSAYLRGRIGAVALVGPWIANGQVTTSVLVYGEIVEYLQGLADYASREAELREVLRVIPPYHLTYSILQSYATLRRVMRPPHDGGLIGDVDTLIAATALTEHVTVVTIDGDFTRVPGLGVLLLRPRELRGA